ncbi:tubby C-terminal-like domain-containing protein [Aspergillus karnatakaensis]|uniref:tubby C-terminal-like domain-containing protein n=1 Tax=Aspergillus karnatakaensis TaxID=1810916 RepID=UPI003CCD3222
MDFLKPKSTKPPIALRPDHITPTPTTIRVKQESTGLSRARFTVTSTPTPHSPHPTKLFDIDGGSPSPSFSQIRHFRDASGLPLFEVERKWSSMNWVLYLPGGSGSGSGRLSEPIATVRPRHAGLKDKLEVRLKNAAAGGEDTTLEVRGESIWKTKTNVLHQGEVVMAMRLESLTAVHIPGMHLAWEVEVARGVDLALIYRLRF